MQRKFHHFLPTFRKLHFEKMEASLLQRYRHNCQKLLDFIVSSGLIKEIRTSSGATASVSDINFDSLSVDYVLQCIQSGGVLDISEATKRFTTEFEYPVLKKSQSVDSYFLKSPESSGPPPRPTPPHPEVNREYGSSSARKEFKVPSLGLPALRTGLSDDDLRESAYEICLASLAFHGVEIHSIEDQKKDKGTRCLAGLKNKKEKRHVKLKSPERRPELIDIFRVQMQISEAMDACIRQKLKQFALGKAGGRIDASQISLVLLNKISKTEFPSERSYIQFKNRQVSLLEEHFYSVNHIIPDLEIVQILLNKIRDSKKWDMSMSAHQRADVILAIKEFASVISSISGQFGMRGETCYWTASYHLNIRLYEALLLSLFDILEEGQLLEEAEEILKLLKLTWSTLGITQKLHSALYVWVLLKQFVETDDEMLLDHSRIEFEKVLSVEDNKEEYVNKLTCFTSSDTRLNLVEAISWSISLWCDNKLQDYHLHFVQKPAIFRKVLTMAIAAGTNNSGEIREIKSAKSDDLRENSSRKVRMYIERSVQAAYNRVSDTNDLVSKNHPLALLARELMSIAEREITVFYPVLGQWFLEAGVVSAVLLHQYFGEKLKPFLEGVSILSEDVRSVLSAAHKLENKLNELYSLASNQSGPCSSFSPKIDHYQIGKISCPIILDWVFDQHARILEWTGRAFDLEEWEPLSSQQKQAASAVEIFRIIEKTMDQFFELNLPINITHIQALLSVIFHTLDGYLQKLVNQLVDKKNLYPSTPSLTRYEETMFPIIKEKVIENVLLEEEVNKKLEKLTVPKLCIRLNTLQYIQKQIDLLEDRVRKSWVSVSKSKMSRFSEELLDTSDSVLNSSESVDALFVTTLDCLRDTAAQHIRNICEFTGARVVFWDLKDSFLFQLYHGSVESARLDSIIPHFDTILNYIRGSVDDNLRDLVVLRICSASLEGYIWVLLDGGPSRAFSDSDIPMMEEDLNILKDLFVADGEGLPRSLVEVEAKLAHQILVLFSLKSESVIEMLKNANEYISTGSESSHRIGQRVLEDAHTLRRVLCHKKDK